MATEKQLIKLEYIQKRIKCAKEEGKDVAESLSNGRIGYKKAIKSVMQVGVWSTIAPIFALGALALNIYIAHLSINNWIMSDYEIVTIAIAVVSSIIAMVLGYKLWNLDATPLFALVSLIIILICNIALFVGILPLIVVILDIIALIRFSTFCSWFHSLKVK